MATYPTPVSSNFQLTGSPQVSIPYGNIFNPSPYENYMGRINNNPTSPQNSSQFLKCRPVSSKEEAIASQIDLDGSLWVFTDVGNGKIYTKQINNDGTATFRTYAQIENENTYSTEYVTKDEFNKVIQSLVAAIQNTTSSSQQKKQDSPVTQKQNQLPLNF